MGADSDWHCVHGGDDRPVFSSRVESMGCQKQIRRNYIMIRHKLFTGTVLDNRSLDAL